MPKKKVKLPGRLAEAIRYICSSSEEVAAAFHLPPGVSKAIMKGRPVELEKDELEYVEAILANELRYGFKLRILQLLHDQEKRKLLLQWVHTTAAMICMFRSLKSIQTASNFVNGFDPFLSPLNSMVNVMNEVESFLYRIHEEMPQFDEQFFSGTGFLSPQEIVLLPAGAQRVPSCVDVLSLSKEDEVRRNQLKQEQGAQDGNHTEERG